MSQVTVPIGFYTPSNLIPDNDDEDDATATLTVCISVYISVSRVTQNVVDRYEQKFSLSTVRGVGTEPPQFTHEISIKTNFICLLPLSGVGLQLSNLT